MKLKSDWGLWPIPSGAYSAISTQVDSLFDRIFGKESLSVFKSSGYPYDVYIEKDNETPVASVIQLALAGVTKDRIKVTVYSEDGVDYVAIVVDKKEEENDKNKSLVYKKISNTSYRVGFALSASHDSNNVTSVLKDGLLTVRVPLLDKKDVKPPVKEVDILSVA